MNITEKTRQICAPIIDNAQDAYARGDYARVKELVAQVVPCYDYKTAQDNLVAAGGLQDQFIRKYGNNPAYASLRSQ